MHLIDFVILGLIAIAFIAVCVRTWKYGTCVDCAAAGVCTGHCSREHQKHCAAFKGLDQVEKDLSKGL